MASCELGSTMRSLECPICTDILTDPRILPCGHSICGPKSEDQCIIKLEHKGSILCPTCRTPHQIRGVEVPPVYGFKDMLESLKKKQMCVRHNQEILFFCHVDKQEVCIMCWHTDHMGEEHRVEPLLTLRQQQMKAFWQSLDLKKFNKDAQNEVILLESHIEDLEKVVKNLKEEKQRKEGEVDCSAKLLEKEQDINQCLNPDKFDQRKKELLDLHMFQKDLELNGVTSQHCLAQSLELLDKVHSSLSGQVKNANALTGEPLETKEEIETEDNEDAEAEGHRSQEPRNENGEPLSTQKTAAPFGWTKSCVLQRIDIDCWWELLYCPESDHVYFATMTNAIKKYRFDNFASRLIPEDSYQFKSVISSIALGQNRSIYISFRSNAEPNVRQFWTRTRLIEKLETSMISKTTDHRLKWILASYPEKNVLLIMASYSGAFSNSVYVFHDNNFVQEFEIHLDTRFAHIYPFGLKTGLLSDCQSADETVFSRIEWQSLLSPTGEYRVKHFFEVTDPNCQLVHISDVTEARRRIVVLGYKESANEEKLLVGHIFESRKVKSAAAEFISSFELSQSTDCIPYHFISFDSGIVLGKERISDNVMLMKLI